MGHWCHKTALPVSSLFAAVQLQINHAMRRMMLKVLKSPNDVLDLICAILSVNTAQPHLKQPARMDGLPGCVELEDAYCAELLRAQTGQ